MKKVIIVGAGISGLAAGTYALKNGYSADIYEMHSITGGECTGWDRGGYHFDGCIHWLMGSKKGSALNQIWRETGALDDSVRVINGEYFGQYEQDGRVLTLYRDVDRLERHLLELSPKDSRTIKRMCAAIRGLRGMAIPCDKPLDMLHTGDMVKLGFSMLPYALYMKYGKITIAEFVQGFSDPLIKIALTEPIPPDYSALSLLSTLGTMANEDAGWPEGGSRRMAQRMEARFKALGGSLFLRSRVEKILIEEGIAKGILLADGQEVYGDTVITAIDGHEALFHLLDGKYLSEVHKRMYDAKRYSDIHASFQAWAGIAADLSGEPEAVSCELPLPVEMGGRAYDRIWFKNYCFDKTMVPEGGSVLTAYFHVYDFDWWQNIYSDKAAYKKEKEHIANVMREAIEKRFPAARGKIEQINVATPMTYVRYCNAWRGAWMSWATTPKLGVRFLPMRLEGLSNFIMAGQWVMPPGGLPTAVITGKWAVQHLCAGDKKVFKAD